jgi:hypothetical protein
MKPRPKYFNRNGDEIDERAALDHRGALRDGCTLHVPLQMKDGLSATQLSVRDTVAARDAREQAYRDYDTAIQEAWRNTDPRGRSFESTGFGESGQRGAVEGDSCTIDGVEGRLRMFGGQLQCVPLRVSSDSAAKFTDGTPDGGGNRPGWRIRIGDNRQAARDALRDYENDLVNRWRGPNAPCPSCQGTGEARRQSS